MSRAHHSGAQPSQRMLRVGELVRHVLSEVLTRGALGDPALDKLAVTVPEVRMSPDLKVANVYVTPLGGGDARPLVEALDRHRKLLRAELAHRMTVKFAPDLKFRVDESVERSARIDALLNSPAVRRDLAGGGGGNR